jgi:hypothetical protein
MLSTLGIRTVRGSLHRLVRCVGVTHAKREEQRDAKCKNHDLFRCPEPECDCEIQALPLRRGIRVQRRLDEETLCRCAKSETIYQSDQKPQRADHGEPSKRPSRCSAVSADCGKQDERDAGNGYSALQELEEVECCLAGGFHI